MQRLGFIYLLRTAVAVRNHLSCQDAAVLAALSSERSEGRGAWGFSPLGSVCPTPWVSWGGAKSPPRVDAEGPGGSSGRWCHGEGLLAKRIRARGKLVVIPAPSWFGDEINAGLL